MTNFSFAGKVSASKSLLNRALILKSYFSEVELAGDSHCRDVSDLKTSLDKIHSNNDFFIHEGGTTFRFLTLRLSRIPGHHRIKASQRLLARPQDEIIEILKQFNVRSEIRGQDFIIEGDGWRLPQNPVMIERSRSSQFLSALILNSPKLDRPLSFRWRGAVVSDSYFQMTLQMAQKWGLQFEPAPDGGVVLPWNFSALAMDEVGADMSSVFTLACVAAKCGSLQVTNIFEPNVQPDAGFISLFRQMGIPVQVRGNVLGVESPPSFSGIDVNLANSPDLFPVLACLCATANSPSRLDGAPQLRHKESNRLEKVFELFDLAKIKYAKLEDGIVIEGNAQPHPGHFEFNPDHDHRMAMAAAFLKMAGWNIGIKTPQVVDKSFPEFWSMLGIQP